MKAPSSMHIIYILTKLELGGAQKVCLSLFRGVKNTEHSSSLITGEQGELVSEAKKYDNVFLLSSLKREVGFGSFFSELRTFRALIKILKDLKKKHSNVIVHTHSTKAGIIGRWAAFFVGIKKRVHTIHGYGFHDHQPKWQWNLIFFLEYLTSLITSKFICVSEKDLKTGAELFPKFKKKAVLIRAAVDWDIFYLPAKKMMLNLNQPFRIGTFSCFKPQKNLLDLFKAFHYACELNPDHNMRLEIIGDGPQATMLHEFTDQYNIAHITTFHGWQHSPISFLKQWDLFAMSSLWEGLPCSIIEARLQKIPVVAYNVGGINEVIESGRNGYLIEPGNWQQLGSYFASLSSNPALHNRLTNYEDNLSAFNKVVMIQEHLSLYQKIVLK